MKKLVAGMLALLMMIFAVGCNGRQYPEKVVVTCVKAPLNVPTMVEKEEGVFQRMFAEYGVAVEYANITNGSEQTQALASGDVQFLFAVGAPSVLLAAASGLDIRIIGAYSSSPKAYQMITGDENICSASDLAGKVIAGPKGTTLNELLVAYLAEADLSVEDVEYVAMSIGDAQAALEAGQVDVALLAGINAYRAAEAGYRILTDGESLIDGTVLVAASEAFCVKYPELVKCFTDAHRAVLKMIEDDHDAAMKIAEEATGLEQQAVEEMYTLYDFHGELTQKDLDSLEKTKRFMLESGMIERDIPIEDILWLPE